MPLPTVVFNSSTGSDTAASGYAAHATLAATAVSGAGAAMANSTTVDLSADSPDLSLVAAGDLFWADASSLRQFSIITARDNTAKTVTCADTFTLTESGKNWGIGGKRATFDNADSRTLFGATGGKGGWTVKTETDQTVTAEIGCSIPSDSAAGAFFIEGDSASTRRIITSSANDQIFAFNVANLYKIKNLQYKCSNGTKTAAHAYVGGASATIASTNCVFGDVTNTLHAVYTRSGGTPCFILEDCEVKYCTVGGIINVEGQLSCTDTWFHHNAIGASLYSGSVGKLLERCLFTDNTGDGIKLNTTTLGSVFTSIINCTIDGNGGDGIDASTNGNAEGLVLKNNILSNNANYGFRGQSGGTGSDTLVAFNDGNAYYTNTSGNRTGLSAGPNDVVDVDPGYANAGSDDYSISSASLKGKGVPLGGTRKIGANNSGTYSYTDIGAAQHLEPTVPGEGDVREGISYGNSQTGTLFIPLAADVRDGVQYGEDEVEYLGVLQIPLETTVRDSVTYGNNGVEFTGNLTLPDVSEVELGVEYGAEGNELTGELDPGGGSGGGGF